MRLTLSALLATLAVSGPAQACVRNFPSEQARVDYYAKRAAEARDVILGQVVDLIAVPLPSDASQLQGDATLVVLKVRKGAMSAGDRVVVPMHRRSGGAACGWESPKLGATYEVYLTFDKGRGEYRVLESASGTGDTSIR